MPFNGIIFERAVERSLAAVIAADYQLDGEPLNGVQVHTTLRGVPIIFLKLRASEDESGNPLDDAEERGSYLVLTASGYQEHDGEEMCLLRTVVATSFFNGGSDELAAEHEKRISAMRGILSPHAVPGLIERANQLSEEVMLSGLMAAENEGQDEFTGRAWIHERIYQVTGGILQSGF